MTMTNLETCHRHKEAWKWASPHPICTLDPKGRNIVEIAEAGDCPKDFFNNPDELLVQVKVRKEEAEKAHQAEIEAELSRTGIGYKEAFQADAGTINEKLGRQAWRLIHLESIQDRPVWRRMATWTAFVALVTLLRTCGCSKMLDKLVSLRPHPAWDAPADEWWGYFYWLHGEVNSELKKPNPTEIEAKAHWLTQLNAQGR